MDDGQYFDNACYCVSVDIHTVCTWCSAFGVEGQYFYEIGMPQFCMLQRAPFRTAVSFLSISTLGICYHHHRICMLCFLSGLIVTVYLHYVLPQLSDGIFNFVFLLIVERCFLCPRIDGDSISILHSVSGVREREKER